MEKSELQIVQKVAKEILFDIVDVCENNNIEYFLMYGTLIGAVRHRGIIPWDDDIDIGMTRENYQKFLQVAGTQLSPENHLILMGDRDSLSEIKIGRYGTVYCLKEARDLSIASEITVDIFLIDFVKESAPLVNTMKSRFRSFLRLSSLCWDEKKLLFISIDKSTHRMKWLYKLGLNCMHLLRMILGETGINRIIYKMYVDKSGKSGRLACASFDNYSYPAEYKIIKLPFEGRLLNAMNNYDEMLKKEYGDYMQLPPEDKRYNSHIKDWVLEIKEENL